MRHSWLTQSSTITKCQSLREFHCINVRKKEGTEKIVQDAPWNEDSQPQATKHTVQAMTWYPGSCSPQWMNSPARFLECKQPTRDKASPAPNAISLVPSAVRSPAWLPRPAPPPRPCSPLNHFASFFFLCMSYFLGCSTLLIFSWHVPLESLCLIQLIIVHQKDPYWGECDPSTLHAYKKSMSQYKPLVSAINIQY